MEYFIFNNKRRKTLTAPATKPCLFVLMILLACACLFLPKGASADSGAREQLDFADGLYARQMYGMAITEYEKFVAAHPDSRDIAKAYFMIGESFFYMKEYREASDKFYDYLKRFPQDAAHKRARLRIAVCRIEFNDYQAALAEIEKALEGETPAELLAEALYLSGLAKIGKGRIKDGIKDFEKAAATGGGRYAAAAAYKQAQMRWDNGEFEKAADFFRKSKDLATDAEAKGLSELGVAQAKLKLKKYAQAEKHFSRLVDEEEAGPEVRGKAVAGLLSSLFSLQRYEDVIELYKEKRRMIPLPQLRFEAALITVQAHSRKARYEEAVSLLDELLEEKSLPPKERDTALLDKAAVLLLAGKAEEAKSLLAAIDKSGNLPRHMYLKAEASYYSGAYDEAITYYLEALSAFSGPAQGADAAYGLAHAFLKAGKKAEAKDAFVKFSEEYAGDKRASAALYSALILDNELGLKEEGVSRAKAFIGKYPDDENAKNALFLLGLLYTDLKQAERAIATYKDYEQKYPGDERIQEVYFLLGRNYQVSERPSESNAYYEKIERGEKDEKLHYNAQKNIAQNCMAIGDEVKAARTLKGIMAGYPENDLDVEAYLWTAKIYIDIKQHDIALEILAMAEGGEEYKQKQAGLLYYKSEARRGLGLHDEAIKGYRECVDLDKRAGEFTGPAFIGIGLSQREEGRAEDAIKSFERAILFNPEDNTVTMHARFNIAGILMRQERFEEAARMFMMVAILYDDTNIVPEALYSAAVAFHNSGRAAESEKAYRDLAQKFPSYEKLGELKETLGK